MTRRSRRSLHTAVDAYLVFRRSLGFSLAAQDKPLHDFVSFVDADPSFAGVITTDLALRWATRDATTRPRRHAMQLSMVRGFTRYWKQRDPRTQVPPTSILLAKAQRRSPVLLEDDEVQQLMLAAASLRTISPLWRSTVTMIVGLLAVTGMRVGEVVSLDDDDVDWDEGVLKVKRAKFGKSRLVPLHRSTTAALRRYMDERGRTSSTSALFRSPTGGRPSASHVRASFKALLRLTNLPRSATTRRPTLHDFRHRFAIKTLVNWYRSGADVGQTMPALCTYLGHVNINSTYWYLSAAPELLGVACDRLERQLARTR